MQFLPVSTCNRVWRLCIPTGWSITGWRNNYVYLIYSDTTDIVSLTLTLTDFKARMDRIHHICNLNSAACFLKVGELTEALKCCNQVTGPLYDIDSRFIDTTTCCSIWNGRISTSCIVFLPLLTVCTCREILSAAAELLCTEYDG